MQSRMDTRTIPTCSVRDFISGRHTVGRSPSWGRKARKRDNPEPGILEKARAHQLLSFCALFKLSRKVSNRHDSICVAQSPLDGRAFKPSREGFELRSSISPHSRCSACRALQLSRKVLKLPGSIWREDNRVVKYRQSNSHSIPVKICGRVCKVVVPGLPITCSWQGPSLSTYSFQRRFGGHRGLNLLRSRADFSPVFD
jgi:hypothetical protein